MEEVQRMGESGEAVAICREWELKDAAVQWLLTERSYVEVRERKMMSSHHSDDADADADATYVLLLQVQRDFESVKRACLAGKEEVVVTRSFVEDEARAVCQLLASFGYLECPAAEMRSNEEEDLRYYYRAVNCRLRLPASDSDMVDVQPVEGHRSAEGALQDWKACCSLAMDTSRIPAHTQLSVIGTAGNGATVMQTPLIRFRLDAWARADEFHLDLKLKVVSLSVGVSKREFEATDTCLGFFPDWIHLSMEPCWAEEQMSEAIFENKQVTETPHSSSSKSTQNTEIGVAIGLGGSGTVSAKRSWGKEKTAWQDDIELDVIDYETEEGGVASIEWKICRWGDGKPYKSGRPLSPSLISGKKLPKLPFKGTTPPLKDLAAVSWRLPIKMRSQELTVKIRLCFHMQLISLTTRTAVPFLRLPKHKKIRLEQEFGSFVIQLPAALRTPDVAALRSTNSA